MTGKRSSDKSRGAVKKLNIWRHDTAFVLGRNGWILLAGTVIFLILIPFFTAGLPGDSIYNVEVTHDQLKFRLINDDVFIPVMVAAVVVGLVVGSSMFRFVQDKKETTIFFSMGITRTRLFADRLVTAFAMLALMTAIPLAVSTVLNINAVGGYQCLVRNAVFLCIGLLLMAAVSCTVAVIMSLLSGSLMDLVIYWACGMSIPTVICCGINILMKKLYWGNAWGVVAYSGTEQIGESLLERFSILNPLLFFKGQLETHAQFMRPLSTDTPEDVSWWIVAVWGAVLAALVVLAWWILKKWKAENAGITGSCRIFAEITAALTGFMMFALVCAYIFDYSTVLAVILGILAFAAMHLFWKKAGIFGRIKVRTQLTGALIQLAATGVICIVFATGFFGGTERFLNDASADITEAKVNYVGAPAGMYEEAKGSSTGHGYYVSSQLSLQEDDSIDTVRELQMLFEESGREPMKGSENAENTVIPYDITFSYVESDGTEHTWYYDRASYGQLEKMLDIEELDEVKNGQAELFAYAEEGNPESLTKQAYDNGTVYLTDDTMTDTYEVTLGEDRRAQLLAAIWQDMSGMSVKERYFPEERTEAVIMFTQSGDDDSLYFSYHLNNAFIYVTPRYENTLKWLEENKLLECVQEEQQIESIILQRMDPYIGINAPDYPIGMYFMAYCADSADEFMIQKDFGDKYVIDDSDDIAEVSAGLRDGYYMSGGGYLAAVKLSGDDMYRYMFLPQSEVPSFIRQ